MGLDRIVLPRNSYKHDHRCVAGSALWTKQWVRLVGQTVPGCLTLRETCYPDGREVALLDVFEAASARNAGSNCHPEDVYVTGNRGSRSAASTGLAMWRFLAAYVNKGPSVLQGYGDRSWPQDRWNASGEVPRTYTSGKPVVVDTEENGKRKNRASSEPQCHPPPATI